MTGMNVLNKTNKTNKPNESTGQNEPNEPNDQNEPNEPNEPNELSEKNRVDRMNRMKEFDERGGGGERAARADGDLAELDVVVVGGGAAGLSAALTLARARRTVLVIDSGEPRNASASGVHGLLGREGVPPAELVRTGREEVGRYGGLIVPDTVTGTRRDGDRIVVETAGGRSHRARHLLVASGLVDELPAVPGLRERWGRDVLHCPYCHGWEVRDEPVGVLASGPRAVHQALLLRQWTPDVTLFLHTADDPDEEQWEQLAARGVAVVDGEVTGLVIEDDRLCGVRLASGRRVPLKALALTPRFLARGEVLSGLGVTAVEHPMGVGRYVEADARGATGVRGVWVAGNVADLMASVAVAAASGTQAAMAINAELMAADTAAAVSARRSAARAPRVFAPAAESAVGERVLGERRHGFESLLGGDRGGAG
ncbi:NAD(P)/FAD-dependent oxidoreductase [Streptomyces sp. ICN441]|uniref:NAD(P)/FAD-dependent oxidoreductase n=1 Tax=Streptomyces sp. ICN441 TaxID=2558286 RepID=UPI00106AB1C2|nr:NAD(P)/FAD-dependent oxidoreductase [Streptomyces sp. ICN441]TFE50678.1 NAD(P)/FAD-dependent oxidoreductase [Streptomyces sp. ICN441]